MIEASNEDENCRDDSPHDIEAVLSLLHDAIDLTPTEEKQSYIQATIQCPELVKEESDPLVFLKYEDYDIFRAANRLLKYWKWRAEIYEERAFLKLNDLTGFGACDESIIKIMGKRSGIFLPGRDKEGTMVLFFDRRRLGKEFYNNLDPKVFLKGAFFTYQNVIDKYRAEGCHGKAGYALLNLVSSGECMSPFLGSKNSWPNLINEAMPFELRWVRTLILQSENKDKTWFRAILPSLQLMLQKRLSFTKLEILSFDTKVAMKCKLVEMGLKEESLPECIGGKLKIEDHWGRNEYGLIDKTVYHTRGFFLDDNNNTEPELDASSSTDEESINSTECCLCPLESQIDSIPFGDKVALLKAKQYANATYQKESFQQLFLAFHHYNASSAALHLCDYWELRNKLFSEMGFLWMNQLGTGALNKDDIKVLRSGILQVLPKDNDGNVVLLYDHTKTSAHPFASIRRCLFYMLFLIMEKSVLDGNCEKSVQARLLFRADDSQGAVKHRKMKNFLDILQVFPFRLAAFLVISKIEASLSKERTQYADEAALQVFLLFDPPKEKMFLLSENSPASIFNLLQDHGFTSENIPHYVGGKWTEESFFIWQDRTAQYEVKKKNTSTTRTFDTCFYFCQNDLEWKQSSKRVHAKRKNPQGRGHPEVEKRVTSASMDTSSFQVSKYTNYADLQLSPVLPENLDISLPSSNSSTNNVAAVNLPYSFRRGVVDFWLTRMHGTTLEPKDEIYRNRLN